MVVNHQKLLLNLPGHACQLLADEKAFVKIPCQSSLGHAWDCMTGCFVSPLHEPAGIMQGACFLNTQLVFVLCFDQLAESEQGMPHLVA